MNPRQQAFLERAAALALSNQSKTGIPAALQIAQAAMETGWGEKAPGNNYFGIKANSKGAESANELQTFEYIDGQREEMKLGFAAYSSAENSFADHARLLTIPKFGPYSRHWNIYLADGNLKRFVYSISRIYAPGATPADTRYADAVWNIMNSKRVTRALDVARNDRLEAIKKGD